MRDTKRRIVEAAVHLFNTNGVAAVTTNHIAAHLGISPGNLYYHFHDKQEIIRHAFDRMNAEADKVWSGPSAPQEILTGNLTLYAKYTFFARELPALLRADPVLKKKYRKIHAQRVEQLELALVPLLSAGKDDIRTLVESAWIIGLFGLPYGELLGGGRLSDEIARGARRVLHLFKPYMEPTAYQALVAATETALETIEP